MPTYRTPGVYVEETSSFPPSVADVQTAIPAFIGYTERAVDKDGADLGFLPTRITSLPEFETWFGKGPIGTLERVDLDQDGAFRSATVTREKHLYDALRLFFENDGSTCYIVSIGSLSAEPSVDDFARGLEAIKTFDEPTMLLFPDAVRLSTTDLATVQMKALSQCAELMDRMTILDTLPEASDIETFRNALGLDHLKYGAAYTPWLTITHEKRVGLAEINALAAAQKLFRGGVPVASISDLTTDASVRALLAELTEQTNLAASAQAERAEQDLRTAFAVYDGIIRGIDATPTDCPPSGAIAGIYARVDRERGVWKAPANVSLNGVLGPSRQLSRNETDQLTVDTVAGKSINAILTFAGKGTLVWGARTLAGNNNEWRYVPVRRFFTMVEESVKKSTAWVVFETNDINTWTKVRGMIENYLTQKWREGALAGATTKDAFFVHCGLGTTMTAQDILEGRMIVEIGMAAIRPAEFIILRFSHRLQAS